MARERHETEWKRACVSSSSSSLSPPAPIHPPLDGLSPPPAKSPTKRGHARPTTLLFSPLGPSTNPSKLTPLPPLPTPISAILPSRLWLCPPSSPSNKIGNVPSYPNVGHFQTLSPALPEEEARGEEGDGSSSGG